MCLTDDEKQFFQSYVNGVNKYIETRQDNFPVKLKLAGITPEKWTIADSLSVLYYMGWGSSANLQDEIITQMLIEKLGPAKAQTLFPLNINPDDISDNDTSQWGVNADTPNLNIFADTKIKSFIGRSNLEIGSNNWVANASLSPGDKPIVSNDPHLDATKLPGPWYPIGLFCPDFRAVGVNVPGIPGMVIGRTDYFALGITNAYGDSQDLYVETVDPENSDRYLEGEKSLEFKVIDEVIRVKDKEAPGGFREEKYQIKLTRRGPVISDDLKDLKTDKLMTLRFSMFEGMAQELGLRAVLYSKDRFSVDDHWNFMRDTKNLMAEKIAPIMAASLKKHPDTKQMGEILAAWDYLDDIDKAAPSIFQSVYRNFAILVYKDELGEELASVMLDNWYYWQEKLLIKVLDGEFEWFDDVLTPNKETLDDLFYQAGLNVQAVGCRNGIFL